MEYLVAVPVVLLLASIPWIVWPLRRVVETEQVGFVLERLLYGFWFQVGNLSDRKNALEIKEHKLKKQLSKVRKDLEDEKKALKEKVRVLNKDYQSHLHDQGGKRTWKYLFRKVHVPSFAFTKELLKKESKPKDKRKVTYFTLENAPLPPGWHLNKDAGRVTKHFVFRDNERNAPQQNSGKKGSHRQNQQQKNQQQQQQ